MKKTIHNESYKYLIFLLQQHRKAKKIKQVELSKLLGMNEKYISTVETLDRRIDVIELWNICNAIEMDFVELAKKNRYAVRNGNETRELILLKEKALFLFLQKVKKIENSCFMYIML